MQLFTHTDGIPFRIFGMGIVRDLVDDLFDKHYKRCHYSNLVLDYQEGNIGQYSY
jgi:hypothetical protein